MAKVITSTNWAGEAMTLVDEQTLTPIREGDIRTTRGDEQHRVTGGRAPHKPGSSGKVWTALVSDGDGKWTSEFYPAVIGAKWMHDSALAAHQGATDAANQGGATPGASSVMLDEHDADAMEAFERSGPRAMPRKPRPRRR